MKKILTSLLAAVMVLGMSVTAFASESPGNKIEGDGVTEAPQKDQVSGTQFVQSQQTISGDGITFTDLDLVGVVDIDKNFLGSPDGDGYYTVTIRSPLFKAGSTYVAIHHDEGTDTWSYANYATATKDGELTIKLKDFSSYAFAKATIVPKDPNASTDVVYVPILWPYAANGAAAGGNTSATSPKTGSTAPVLPVLAVTCLAGAVICGKKVKFNA